MKTAGKQDRATLKALKEIFASAYWGVKRDTEPFKTHRFIVCYFHGGFFTMEGMLGQVKEKLLSGIYMGKLPSIRVIRAEECAGPGSQWFRFTLEKEKKGSHEHPGGGYCGDCYGYK